MLRIGLVLSLAVTLALLIAGPASARSPWAGYLSDGSGAQVKVAGQGGLHQLVLRDAKHRRSRYRVCIRGGAGHLRRCFDRRLSRSGRGTVEASVLINDRGGPGRYAVRWEVEGKTIARWRFRLTPEGV